MTAIGGGLTKTTVFTLTVAAPLVVSTVATPTITPNGGSFTNSVPVTLATATSGASIYYTTDGSSPTQSSKLYSGVMTLTTSAVVKAKAFKSGYNSSAEASASFASDLVAYWKFDEGTGTTTADSSGNGNAGTLINGPQWAPGIAGKALYFDGIDDNVTVLDSTTLNPSSAFTISAWVNPATTFTDFRSILVKNYKYYLYSNVIGYCGDGNPVGGFSETANTTVCQPSPLPINTWTHLSLTYDGSMLTLYRGGIAVASSTASGTLQPTTETLQIGASQYGEYFQGLIDEVRIYSRALKATEIQAIYQQMAVSLPFDYSMSSSGDRSVNAGSSVTDTISASLVSGAAQAVSFGVSGLPSGATASFSSASCALSCSTVVTISTSGSTPAGSYPVTVTAAGGGMKRSTLFTLSVTLALTVATPTITPNGATFTSSVSMTLQSATSGSSIYYTTDGSTPTQTSILYTGAMTLTSNATVNAKAFKSGYNPSALASASFTNSSTSTISSASYYVGKNGSDSNSCTQARSSSMPKLTIGAALACIGTSPGAGAGQIVEVAAGIYNESIFNTLPSGTSWSAPFILRAKAGDTVMLKASTDHHIYSSQSYALYLIIDGFVFDGTNLTNTQIFFIGPSFIKITNVQVINTAAENAFFIDSKSHDIEVSRSKIHDGKFSTTSNSMGINHAFYIGGYNNLIQHNEIYNVPAWAVHIYGGVSSTNVVRGNLIHDSCQQVTGCAGILLGTGNGNRAYNNILYNGKYGISSGNNATNSGIFNNTIYNMAYVGIDTSNSTGSIIKNNIVYGNPTAINNGGTNTIISNNFTTDPRFVNSSAGNFRLQSGSAAINAGADLTSEAVTTDIDDVARPYGASFDIGAYEYVQ